MQIVINKSFYPSFGRSRRAMNSCCAEALLHAVWNSSRQNLFVTFELIKEKARRTQQFVGRGSVYRLDRQALMDHDDEFGQSGAIGPGCQVVLRFCTL